MRFLRTNTATIVTVGPFYDKTDGVTIETGLTITNERISATVDLNDGSAPTLVLDNVTGATSGTANDLNYITNCDAGLMQLELAAANVNYLGRFFLTITDAANHVPVFHEFMILPAVVYDSLVLGSDKLQVHADEITNGLITAAAIADNAIDAATFAADVDAEILSYLVDDATRIDASALNTAAITSVPAILADTGTDGVVVAAGSKTGYTLTATTGLGNQTANITGNLSGSVGSVTGAVGSVTGAVGSVGAGGITASSIADAAIDAATFAADVDAEIAAMVWNAAAASYGGAGTYGQAIEDILVDTGTTLQAELDGIQADTEDLQSQIGVAGAGLTAVPWNAAWDAEVQSECADALTAYDPPTNAEMEARTIVAANYALEATLATVDGIVDDILADTGADGVVVAAGSKTGYALSSAGIDAVWDQASSLTLSFEALLTRAYQMINNKMEVTDADGTVSLKNIGATGAIASGSVTDNSTTTTRLELTWA